MVSPKTSFDGGSDKQPGVQAIEARLGKLGGGLVRLSTSSSACGKDDPEGQSLGMPLFLVHMSRQHIAVYSLSKRRRTTERTNASSKTFW